MGCVYSWLTIATTTDVRLLTNTSSSPLPVIGTAVPIAGFYGAAPVLLLGVFLFLHLGLQHLWGLVSTLPAVFPDGVPEDKKAYPWLLTGLLRSHVPRLRDDLPALARLRASLAITLAWWIVPATMLVFWARYLPRQHWPGTSLHVVLVVVSVMSAILLQTMARETLRGDPSRRFSWRTAGKDIRSYRRVTAVLGTAAIMVSLSHGAIAGTPRDWIPRAFSVLGYNVFADLREATAVSIADLRDFLRYADLTDADLTDAPLSDADLTGATLTGADLHNATLIETTLTGAILTNVLLTDADLTHANLTGAILTNALLTDADLTGADLTGADLADAPLTDAKLIDATLVGAVLIGAVLTGADLTDAILRDAILPDAGLGYATLTGVDLTGADLTGALLVGATLTQDQLDLACGNGTRLPHEGLTIQPCPHVSAPPQR